MPNLPLISTLPQVGNISGQFATLTRLDGLSAWRFLVMPTEITFDRAANYSASGAVGAMPSQQWSRTDGWSMSIQNLPLSGLHERRSLTTYIESLSRLQELDSTPSAPPVLAFRWGQRVLVPCILTRFSCRETFWFPNGEVASANISFTLVEIPRNQVVQLNV